MQEGFQASAYTFNMPLKKQLRRKRQLWSVWGHWTHSLDQLGLGLRTLLHRGLKSGIYFAVMCRVWKGIQRACRPQGCSALPSEGALQGGPVPHGPSCRGVPAITSLSRVGSRRTYEGGCSRLPPSRGCWNPWPSSAHTVLLQPLPPCGLFLATWLCLVLFL